jgi:hypothetical protein
MNYELPCGIVLTIDWNYICDPDRDSGIYTQHVDHWWISHVGNRECDSKVANWLRKRLDGEQIEDMIIEGSY